MPSVANEKAVEYLKRSGMDKSLNEAVSGARHTVEHDQGKPTASNHANNLKAEFSNAGLQLKPRPKTKIGRAPGNCEVSVMMTIKSSSLRARLLPMDNGER